VSFASCCKSSSFDFEQPAALSRRFLAGRKGFHGWRATPGVGLACRGIAAMGADDVMPTLRQNGAMAQLFTLEKASQLLSSY
jgi:hypothetical protein